MPNIRSQSITEDGISIVASDGRSFSITRAEVLDVYRAQTGNAATRRQKALDAVKASIVAALGAEQVPASILDFEFNTGDGRLTKLEILSELGG